MSNTTKPLEVTDPFVASQSHSSPEEVHLSTSANTSEAPPPHDAEAALLVLANAETIPQSVINTTMVVELANSIKWGEGWSDAPLWDKEERERAVGHAYVIIPDVPPLILQQVEEQAYELLEVMEQEQESRKQHLLRTALLSRGYTEQYLNALTPEALGYPQEDEQLSDIEECAASQVFISPSNNG